MVDTQAAEVAADHPALVYAGFLKGFTQTEYPESEIARYLADPQHHAEPALTRLTRGATFDPEGVPSGYSYSETMEVKAGGLGFDEDLERTAAIAGARAAQTLKTLAEKNGGSFTYTTVPGAGSFIKDGLFDVEGVSVLVREGNGRHVVSWAFASVKGA